MKSRNLVAKHCREYNKATVQRDRKKAAKRGHAKHRKLTASRMEAFLFLGQAER